MSERSASIKYVAVALAIVAVIAIGLIRINQNINAANPLDGKTYNYTYQVTVESTHILFGADYELYVDGKLAKSFHLDPGKSVTFTFTKTYDKLSVPSVGLSVTSKGGGFGTQNDSATLILKSGSTAKATLRA